jgi:hypothetical protein
VGYATDCKQLLTEILKSTHDSLILELGAETLIIMYRISTLQPLPLSNKQGYGNEYLCCLFISEQFMSFSRDFLS